MEKQIFIINGYATVGKDTFVQFVKEKLDKKHGLETVQNRSSIEKVKGIASLAGWDGQKDEKSRKFLCELKRITTEFNDMSYWYLVECVETFRNTDGLILFLHIREPEEIEHAKVVFEAKTILVKRESVNQITSNRGDKDVFNYDYDIVINNSGTLDDLRKKAFDFTEDVLKATLKKEY